MNTSRVSRPSMLVFGSQGRVTDEIFNEVRWKLNSTPNLSKLAIAIQNLPSFWSRLVGFDSTLARVDGEAYLRPLGAWLASGGSLPYDARDLPATIAFPMNFLLQLIQDNGQFESRCLSVRAKKGSVLSKGKIEKIIRNFTETYVSAVTDEDSFTVTCPLRKFPDLRSTLATIGLVADIPIRGRFHSSTYILEVERLVQFFDEAPDLRFPSPDQLYVPVWSSVDGKLVTEDNLVRKALDNTILHPVNWYKTLKSAINHLAPGQACVAVVGASQDFPPSLRGSLDIHFLSRRHPLELSEKSAHDDCNKKPEGACPSMQSPPHTPPGSRESEGPTSIDRARGHESSLYPQNNPVLSDFPPHAVAFVGMAGIFPGAKSVDELWDLVSTGRSTASPTPERVGLDQLAEDTSQVKWWGNFLEDIDTFDHKFFNKSTREATACDPQQRKLLEVVYEALASSGHLSPETDSDSKDYGCYIGAVMNNYAENLSCHPPTAYATTGTGRSYLSGAISHHFGWSGPAMTIDTACSSSLVAIHTACRAIATGECSRAVAGGANIITSPHDYRDLKAAGFLSPSGQCKPFDSSADGYCRGEGVGVVVLKSLSAALDEDDHILGVVIGSATNQNHETGPIVVPSSKSQASLLRRVMGLANVEPEDVSYVEAHGTGTRVGDPIEVSSLREAFSGDSRPSKLYFSSIKGNIGHAEAASGAAGLIKTLLMLKNCCIPPQASFRSLNHGIPKLDPNKMEIPRDLTSWDTKNRIACVNNYGAAGSNSVVMIREAPMLEPDLVVLSEKPISPSNWPLILTASTEASLSLYAERVFEWVQRRRASKSSGFNLPDILFNLAQRANHALDCVVSTAVSDLTNFETVLSEITSGKHLAVTTSTPPPIILVFSGQDCRYVGLSEDVYRSSNLFRSHIDNCHRISLSLGFEGILPAIFQRSPISDLGTLHTALFALQYSSAKTWMDCGLKIEVVVGHSFGQFTALCISGALSLSDALKLVAGRASLVEKHWGSEPGSMLALHTDREQVFHLLERVEGLEVACFNGPRSYVVVGSAQAIRNAEDLIAHDENLRGSIRGQTLDVTHGFHSKFTEPLLHHLLKISQRLSWKTPTIRLEICSDKQSDYMPDPQLVVELTRGPVYFHHAIERLADRYPNATWLEAGRGTSVTQLVRACVQSPDHHSFMAPPLTSSSAQDSLVNITINLWNRGHSVQYWPFHRLQRRQYQSLSLPPYQFLKTRHWLPYIGSRDCPGVSARPHMYSPEPEEFLSFIKGDCSTESYFMISARSQRFQSLVKGHIMCEHASMPASAYIEVVSRAALNLQNLDVANWTPVVEDLTMKAPVVLKLDEDPPDILLTLRRLGTSSQSWSFSITVEYSQRNDYVRTRKQETTSGIVHLIKRKDDKVSREFRRFNSLIGGHRWQQIMEHPDAEAMQGKHIYRAFTGIVEYSNAFKGVKAIATLGNEAAGLVRISPDSHAPPDQRIVETPMIDSFLQFGGFLVNYFGSMACPDSLFVCHQIQNLQLGPAFSPESNEWLVLAEMTPEDDETVSVDVYVSEAQTKKTVLVALGMIFTKISRTSLTRILRGSSKDPNSMSSPTTRDQKTSYRPEDVAEKAKSGNSSSEFSKREEILRIAASIADIPIKGLSGQESLLDIGIDSLGATEMIGDIASMLKVTIDLSAFLLFSDINAIISHVDGKLGFDYEKKDNTTPPSHSELSLGVSEARVHIKQPSHESPEPLKTTQPRSPKSYDEHDPTEKKLPSINSIDKSFDEVRHSFDQLGISTNALNYWAEIHPDDVRLVLAYVSEAFCKLGCDLGALRPGDRVPTLTGILPRHQQLVNRLNQFLQDESLVQSTSDYLTRTSKFIDTTPGEQIFQEIIDKHLSNAPIRHLLRAVGPHLSACLAGDLDALQVLFGNRVNKKWLEDVYRDWPMLVTATQLLGKFMHRAFGNRNGSGPFRILEIGAGTGGTTRHIVDLLNKAGILFEYHFTDISTTLVQKAKMSFAGIDGITFGVLDVESEPPAEFTETFHVIISTNCIHATRNITSSLANVRKMLRKDGVVALIEMTPTRQLYIFDIIVGLLEGWWLFDDGRSHALADIERWEKAFVNAGFAGVRWSDGESLEAKTVRLICGFRNAASPPPEISENKVKHNNVAICVQEVVYKTVGSEKIHADIYCPQVANPLQNMPIALMIHGGSHIIFSRKDIRPPQTRIMIDMGLLPVSLDHRLCPESRLVDGPMADICDAIEWAQNTLPNIGLSNPDIKPDPDNIVVVGWSSGGQLALSTGWTALMRGLRPPNAILAFYCPTDYEDEWWRTPIQPVGAKDFGEEYDVLEAVQDEAITNYRAIRAWEPLSDPRIRTDPRSRIILHMNWKAQTLPVVIGGLPSRRHAATQRPDVTDWNVLPQPALDEIRRCSPLAQVKSGNYKTPTLLIHGTADDLIPWQQSARTAEEMKAHGIDASLVLVPQGPHICDASHDKSSEGWFAVLKAYDWLEKHAFGPNHR
ncbi:beta-ketoacyl synthase [Colletotrichum salicis]|uniref:Beta-ketoacyl synthase n=1 Tax=Colletotrichum salicis TaxID=1209931 RepID=A0A135UGU7_9PEZI|nr:beta-ketoacyl synthase [Colletotrichum salicis]